MCGSKQSANWTTSTPSLPCSYSLLSNVLAPFPHYTRPIKKEAGWRRCWWFMVFWECAYLCLWEHAFFMCVSGGHVIRCAVYLTSKNPKHLPSASIPSSWLYAKSKLFLAALARHEGTSEECSQHALQHASHPHPSGVWLGGATSVILTVGLDLPTTHHQLH